MLKPIIAVAAPWIISRVVKFFLDSKQGNKKGTDYLFKDGGMPSNHTALVVGLATTVLLEDGVGLLFMMSSVLAMIVSHDAMKLRYEAGKHAAIINNLMAKEKKFQPLNERLGHTFEEVAVGGFIGFMVPIVIYMI